jgi:NitT/TauT family transport system substrate-binding protein
MMNRTGFLATAPLLAATAGAASAQTAGIPIRIGATPNDGFAEAYYGHDAGIFAKAGFADELTSFSNGAQVATGVASGAIDVGVSSVITLANATLRGLPFVYIAAGGLWATNAPTLALCVAADSPIRTAKDLEGKTVSVSGIKDITHLATVAYLANNGADITKINIIEMPFSEAGSALKRGAIAAGIISEPSFTVAMDAGQIRVMTHPFDVIGKNYMVGGWFTTLDWYRKNTATAKRFAAAMYDTARWANANHDKSAVILQKYTKIETAVLSKMVRATYAESLTPAMIDGTLQLALREKFIERPVPANDMIAH